MIESSVRIHGTPCRELSEGARQRVVDSELPFGSCAPNEFFQKRNGLPPSSGDTLIDVRKARLRKKRVKQSGNTAIISRLCIHHGCRGVFLLHPIFKENYHAHY